MKKIIMIILILVLWGTSSYAGCMHYGKAIICKGNTKYELLADCGEPVIKEFVGVQRIRRQEVKIEEWTYHRKHEIFIITIIGNRIEAISWIRK